MHKSQFYKRCVYEFVWGNLHNKIEGKLGDFMFNAVYCCRLKNWVVKIQNNNNKQQKKKCLRCIHAKSDLKHKLLRSVKDNLVKSDWITLRQQIKKVYRVKVSVCSICEDHKRPNIKIDSRERLWELRWRKTKCWQTAIWEITILNKLKNQLVCCV